MTFYRHVGRIWPRTSFDALRARKGLKLSQQSPNPTLGTNRSVQFSSVQFKMVSMRSGKAICAPIRLSGVSPTLPLKQFQRCSDWRCPFFVLSGKIVERFLFLRLSPPGDQQTTQLYSTQKGKPTWPSSELLGWGVEGTQVWLSDSAHLSLQKNVVYVHCLVSSAHTIFMKH